MGIADLVCDDCGHAVGEHDFVMGCEHVDMVAGAPLICPCGRTPSEVIAASGVA